MKKKAIEKIPYLTIPKVSRKKDVKYIGVTAFKDVAHERHLFVEVYRNRKGSEAVPVVRIVLTKKDFGNYFPEKEEWSRQKVLGGRSYYDDDLLWETCKDRRGACAEKRNILLDGKDLDRIKEVCTDKSLHEGQWWWRVYTHEGNIVMEERRKAESRRRKRRRQALNDRIANTPGLPEQEILKRADTVYFLNKHFLYYKKQGCWAQIACSKCGGVIDGRWKGGISYESQFQRWVEEPREGQYGKCPLCGADGKYKCQGKAKGIYSEKIYVFLGQKYKETGIVLRYIEVAKEWGLGLIAGEKGAEMHNASEQLSSIEVARTYFEEGKKPQTDYHKHSWYDGKDFWDDCNLYGNANITIGGGKVMFETYGEMEGTIFQYSAMKEYAEAVHDFNAKDYLETYQKIPQLEMMVKMGLVGVAGEIVKYGRWCWLISVQHANRPDVFLGIRKERVKMLMEHKGDPQLLKAMKNEKRLGQNWTDEQLEQVSETSLDGEQIGLATEYMGIQQLLNRIARYAGCGYGTGCARAEDRISQTACTYVDYLAMRIALGYDLHNTVYQQPRDLAAGHAKMVLESNRQEIDKRVAEAEVKFPMIRKNYRRLRNKYFYEDERFLIRPARSAEEIVMEGRILHHCVGGNNYLEKHDSGKSYILMLRPQEDRETPYITVEIKADSDRIIQWHGAHNRKPDQENMERWLDAYVTRLKCQGSGTPQEAAGDGADGAAVPLLAYA